MSEMTKANVLLASKATTLTPSATSVPLSDQASPSKPRSVPFHQLYALPAPIRTFPLPSFYPSNPLSLFHIAYVWLSHALFPPLPEPAIVHLGVWDPSTHSVHITDAKSMRALWEQGFYGKGNFSRSEPNWLKKEQIRRGVLAGDHVSEQRTSARREERRLAKWDRARTEQEAIERTRREEAREGLPDGRTGTVNGHTSLLVSKAPVGPLELLLLPNSHACLNLVNGDAASTMHSTVSGVPGINTESMSDIQSIATESHPDGTDGSRAGHSYTNGHANQSTKLGNGHASSLPLMNGDVSISSVIEEEPGSLKRRKSVRFSPQVESTTFQHFDPPSSNVSADNFRTTSARLSLNDPSALPDDPSNSEYAEDVTAAAIQNKEHLQLSPEEAFFLVLGLGALSVLDDEGKAPLPTDVLLTLFRQHSYFHPWTTPHGPHSLHPQDPFLVHYAVYHHFRSLGWVPRHGIKFGVDWLLYKRGPVFDHAEFGLIVLPSFSDPWWKEQGQTAPTKTWHWLHAVTRVLSHVIKSLVLIYVDVPPPDAFNKAMSATEDGGGGIAHALKLYTIQEVMVRRWSSNRNR